MISYFHIGNIAKMLTARPDNGLQHKEIHVTKHVISSSKNFLTSQKLWDYRKYLCWQK